MDQEKYSSKRYSLLSILTPEVIRDLSTIISFQKGYANASEKKKKQTSKVTRPTSIENVVWIQVYCFLAEKLPKQV